MSRISHALDGGSGGSLCADTWLHVKRCVLGLLTALAKQSIVFPSLAIQEVMMFLHTCEGKACKYHFKCSHEFYYLLCCTLYFYHIKKNVSRVLYQPMV